MAINEKATVEVQVNGEQAKQELKELEKYANSLKGQIADAYNAGDTSRVKQLTSDLRKAQTQIKTLKKDTTALTEVMNNLDKATPNELRATLKAINRELNSGHVKRGSAEWKYYQQQAKLVTAELQKIKTEVQESEGWLSRFNNGLSKWGGLLATGAATITGVSMALNTLRNNRDAKESSQAELKALTGLDDASIQWLTEQAEQLSTTMDESGLRIRQSSDEILQAYMLIGSKKPELLKDKEALNAVTIEAMRLAAAAKIDLQDAVTATTVSLNMYGEAADQAARYVNVLAAGSKEGAADVSAQAAAIKNAGVAAAGAGVSIEGLQGTIQMLAEKGIEAEPAGTALRKFFLVLQTGPDETNPKVVGLQTALENLNKKSLTAAQIQTMFGEEAFSAATILIDNADKVQQYTEAVTGTNTAMEQAAINSDTNAAKMAQYRNQIKEAGIELMERLNPSLSLLTGWTTKIIVALPILIDWCIKYKGVIVTSAAAISAYTIAVNASTIATKLYNTWTKVATVTTAGFNTVLKANPFGLTVAGLTAIATALFSYVIPNTRKAKDEQKAYNDELEKLTKISDAFVDISKRADNLNKLNDRQKQNLKSDAQAELAIIEDKLTKEEIAYSEQFEKEKKRIQEREDINETTRKVLMQGLDGKFKAQRQAIETLSKQRTELQNIIDKIPDIVNPVVNPNPDGINGDKEGPKAKKENPLITAENKRYYDELSDLKRSYLASDEMTQQEYARFMEDLEMRHLENMMAIAGLEPEKRQQFEQKMLEMRIKFKEACAQQDKADADKASEEAFTSMEKQYQLEIQEATRRHYDSLSSEDAYYRELSAIQQQYYNDILNSTQISEEKKAEIRRQIEQKELDDSERRYHEHQDKIRETVQMAQDIGRDFGTTFAELVTDSESTLADYMKATVTLILDTLEKIMLASVAETQIKALAAGGPFNFFGLAAAAGKIALITAAFETAKGLINNFYTGGYTGNGRWDEPRGIVHAGEFVANRHAVQNPEIRPVLDLIDQAQRNNTIGSISQEDLIRVMNRQNLSSSQNIYNNYSDNSMLPVMSEMIVVLQKVKKRLDEPILSYTKATGRMGVNEAQKLVEQMKNNVSRTSRT